jgi:proteasome lid subunit RPN8/RPN11
MKISNKHEFLSHVLACYPQEACGLVLGDSYKPCSNTSSSPYSSFELSPAVVAQHYEQITCVVHSHTQSPGVGSTFDPRAPSKEDMQAQQASALPFAIVYCDGLTVSEPIVFGDPDNRPELYEREFVFNAQDCLSLAADYYYQQHGILLPECPRDWDWFTKGEDLIAGHFEAYGFYEVTLEQARKSDAILFGIRGQVINHIGVYLGGNDLLHHEVNRLSRIDELSRWSKFIKKVIRHKDIK